MNVKSALFVFIVFVSFFNTIYGCTYLEDHTSCNFTTEQGLNIIDINLDLNEEIEEIRGKIKTPNNNDIDLELLDSQNSQISLYQTRTLPSYGVYTIEIEIVLEDGYSVENKEYSLLYDNSNPLPPVIEEISEVDSDKLRVKGFLNNLVNHEEIIIFNNGFEEYRGRVNSSNNFEVLITKNSKNSLEIHNVVSRDGQEITSPPYKGIFYSEEIKELKFSNATTANVETVDFISNNELAVQDSSGLITTFSPHHKINGTARDGNVVYIQGVPVPVVDNEFETYVMLNEGEEPICVVGVVNEGNINEREDQEICETINTIYSHTNEDSLINLPSLYNLNLQNLDEDKRVTKLVNQGKTTNKVNTSQISQLTRNLFFVDVMYPGGYKREVITVDNEDPVVEILTSSNLYSNSKVGILLKDDIGIDLSTLEVIIGTEILTDDDAIISSASSNSRYSFLEFEVPESLEDTIEIFTQVQDMEGKLATDSKTVAIDSTSEDELIVELTQGGKMVGNRMYVQNNSDVTLNLAYRDSSASSNKPLSLGIVELGNTVLSDYEILEDNSVRLNINSNLILQQNLDLQIPLYVHDFQNNEGWSSEEILTNFEVFTIDPLSVDEKKFRKIDTNIIPNNRMIIEILDDFIDYSTLEMVQDTNFFVDGDYVSIEMRDLEQVTFNYKNLANQERSFTVTSNGLESDPTLNKESQSDMYTTYVLNSNDNFNYFDLFFSQRGNQQVGVRTNSQFHINLPYMEGLSLLPASVHSKSSSQSLYFQEERNRQYNFESYPTIQREQGNEVFFRGKRNHLNDNTDTAIVQGRFLGDEEVASVYVNDVLCTVENRFFICEIQKENYLGKSLDIEFLDSNGNEVDLLFEYILFTGIESPFDAGTQSKANRILAAENQDEEDLDESIECEAEENENFTYTHENGNLTVERLTSNSLSVSVLCSVENGTQRESANILFNFDEIEEAEQLTLEMPSSVNLQGEEENYSIMPKAYNFRDDNLTDDIICSTESSQIAVEEIDSHFQITRLTNDSITQQEVFCSVEDPFTGLEKNGTFEISFAEIVIPTDSNNLGVRIFGIPETLGAGNQQENLITGIYAFDEQGNTITSDVSCTPNSNKITIQTSFTSPSEEQLQLNIVRLTNDSIRDQEVTCSVRGESETVLVSFDRVNTGSNELFISSPPMNNDLGTVLSQTFFFEARSASSGEDITNQIECEYNSNLIRIFPSSPNTLNSDGELTLYRQVNESIDSAEFTCLVTDGTNPEERTFIVSFDEMPEGGPLIPSAQNSTLSINLQESDLITTNSPYSFTRGNLVFDFDPVVGGSHQLYMNGKLIKEFTPNNDLEITITEEDYFNNGLNENFDVYVQDERGESNRVDMRFIKQLEAILEIIFS